MDSLPQHFVTLATWLRGRNAQASLVLLLLITALLAAPFGGDAFGFSSKVVKFSSAEAFAPTSSLERLYTAYNEIKEEFPLLVIEDQEVFLITQSDPNTNITTLAASADIAAALSSEIAGPNLFSTTSFFSFTGDLEGLASNYMCFPSAPDFGQLETVHPCNSFIFVVKLSAENGDVANELVEELVAIGEALDEQYREQGFRVILTGRLATALLVDESTGKGFAIAEGIGLPFIVLIFYWCTQSWRLLLIPGVALVISLITSYAVGGAMAESLAVPEYQPNIMLFLCMAFSIDYSFFLLTRFQEERLENGRSLEDSVALMLQYSGGIVCVSGGLLVVTWIALAFFPVSGLDAVGYCSAVTVLICMLVNLAVCPTILMAFPETYSNTHGGRCCCCRCCRQCRRDDDGGGGEGDEGEDFGGTTGMLEIDSAVNQSPLLPNDMLMEAGGDKIGAELVYGRGVAAADHKAKVATNWYFRLALFSTRWPWNVALPFGVYAIFALGCIPLKDLNFTLGVQVDFGNSESSEAYSTILEDYSASGVFQQPFSILAKPTAQGGGGGGSGAIFTDAYFAATCELARSLADPAAVAMLVVPTLRGVSFETSKDLGGFAPPTCLSAAQAQAWISGEDDGGARGAEYVYSLEELAAEGSGSSVINLTPAFNPFGSESKEFVKQVRAVIDASLATQSDVDFFLYHPVVTEVDSEEFAMSRFPTVFACTLLFCFLCIAIRFRAPLVPFKLLFTVIVPILFVFGLAVGVYQHGVLDWLGLSQFSVDTGMGTGESGISWLLPISTVFLLTGLALDYDIFLYSRVYELRQNGHSNRSSIVRAVEITGPIISCAGVIMALAFSGMLVGDNKYLNEFGFVMIIGVLLDTFVVRTILVPCILSLGGSLNWWPMKMPEPRIFVEGDVNKSSTLM